MKNIISIVTIFLVGFVYSFLKYNPENEIKKIESEFQQNTQKIESRIEDLDVFYVKEKKKNNVKTKKVETFKSGESIYSKLKSKNIDDSKIYKIVKKIKNHNKNILKINENDIITFDYIDKKLVAFSLHEDEFSYTKILLGEKLIIYDDVLPIEKKIAITKGTINNSLYYDGLKSGLDDKLISQLANIFAWDIDFAKDIYPNDKFYVLYEKLYSGKRFIKNGDILLAVFKTRKQDFYGVRYKYGEEYSYYNLDGNSLQKAFIRSPVKFPRVTSKFTYKRFHPILKVNRPHRGVDYGGKINTPIMATGSGKIIYKGTKRAYGKHVIIDHGQGYKTLYAHLNNFNKNIKKNSYVKQSQVIGYMGKTGLATGVHLHYEFKINDVHKNPLTLKLPDGKPVKNKKEFNALKNKYLEILNSNSELENE